MQDKQHAEGAAPDELTVETFERYMSYGGVEIREAAAYFEVNERKLAAWVKREFGISYGGYLEKKSAAYRANLRKLQTTLAAGGNATMQIWLGKQYLGQTEKPDGAYGENGRVVIVDDLRRGP